MNVRPEYCKAVGKWGHTGEGETFEIVFVPPADYEFNLEFDVSALQNLFVDYPELNKQIYDGP